MVSEGAVKCWSQGVIADAADHNERWRHWDYFVATGDRHYEGPTPTVIRSLPPAVHVDAGQGHVCARTSEGEVWCWGLNSTNQLGDNYAGDVHSSTFGLVDRLDMVFESWE